MLTPCDFRQAEYAASACCCALVSVKPGLPGPPPPFGLNFAQAATAAFRTEAGTVVGGFFEFGLNLGKVKPCAARQLWYAALALGLTLVVVGTWLLAGLADEEPQDASPIEIVASATIEAIFPAFARDEDCSPAEREALLITPLESVKHTPLTRS